MTSEKWLAAKAARKAARAKDPAVQVRRVAAEMRELGKVAEATTGALKKWVRNRGD